MRSGAGILGEPTANSPAHAQVVKTFSYVVCLSRAQVVKIFPELGELLLQMGENRRMWHELYLAEIEADPKKTPEEKAAEKDKAVARLAAFLDKYKDVLQVQGRPAGGFGGKGPGEASRCAWRGLCVVPSTWTKKIDFCPH
jgi:hypothetical protein